MADKTVGFKVTEEEHEDIQNLIKSSELQPGEWFRKFVTLVKLESVKDGNGEYLKEINELENHTRRIYELFTHMIQGFVYSKDMTVKELTEKINQKEDLLSQVQQKANQAMEDVKRSSDYAKKIEEANDGLLVQLADLRHISDSNQVIIDEYKEKNDMLTGLVNEYKSYRVEYEKLQSTYDTSIEKLQKIIDQKKAAYKELDDTLTTETYELNRELNNLRSTYAADLERIKEKNDYELKNALLGLQVKYQGKLESANDEATRTIRELYKEIDAIRKDYDKKLEDAKNSQKPVK